jgi:aspartate/methionine/tyrosine aminotransferase
LQIAALGPNRAAILDALAPLGRLGNGVAGGEGAIYFWARLPLHLQDDEAVVAWLIKHAGVCVIPGVH